MRWFVLALLVPLAGCLQPAADATLLPPWSRHACDPSGAEPSGNAPVRAPFHGSLDTLLRGLEEALGIEVPTQPSEMHEGTSWYDLADGGRLVVAADGEEPPMVTWTHPSPWPGPGDGRVRLEQALRDLGMWGPDMTIHGTLGSLTVHQSGQGWVAGALWDDTRYTQPGRHSSLDLRPSYELAASPRLAAEEARPVAQAFIDCVAQDERTGPFSVTGDPHLSVQHQSFAWTFIAQGPRDDSHCGGPAVYVHIDADTAAVHGWSHVGCD